ncbi:MAG: putative rane protein [Rhodoglobus sp.]|nr:putative rane protein [Rhodoglobus sp.]
MSSRPSTITRTWLAFAAIGTGLIHVALVIGAPLPLGIVFALLGLVEFVWGVLTFAREGVAYPRAVLLGALLPVLGWGLLLAASTVSGAVAVPVPLLPLAVTTLFELFIAGTVAAHLRRTGDGAPRVPSLGRYLAGLVAGIVVVVGLTAPALAATQVGSSGQPGQPSPSILPGHDH